ncbi:MAG: metallophosphoesterase family protein [Gemmatimonadaceae bacterium]
MRIVHISDLHLGFRQFQRLTEAGMNQREVDVARAFRLAIDRIIDLRPEVIVIGGDVFHNVRPTNPAILHAFNELSRLTRELADSIVVMIAGNHDTPRVAETGCILRLFAPLGVHVVDREPRRLAFPELGLAILAVPDTMGRRPLLVPDPAARYNLLLLHGEVGGVLPRHAGMADRAALEISREELGPARWSYVALGHYHVHREIAPNAFYSGSIEYASADPWRELEEERGAGIPGKGFVEHDLASGAHTFHHLPGARRLIDLPAFSARGMTSAELDAAISDACATPGGGSGLEGLEDNIVRLVVRDVPRHIARGLDHRALREIRRMALHFHLDTRRPDLLRAHGQGVPGRRPSITDVVRDSLASRVIENDIDREALIDLGLSYLDAADAEENVASMTPEIS